MGIDNKVGTDCGSRGVGRAGGAMGENWGNCNRTTIFKKEEEAPATTILAPRILGGCCALNCVPQKFVCRSPNFQYLKI